VPIHTEDGILILIPFFTSIFEFLTMLFIIKAEVICISQLHIHPFHLQLVTIHFANLQVLHKVSLSSDYYSNKFYLVGQFLLILGFLDFIISFLPC